MMSRKPRALALEPSRFHRQLLSRTVQSNAYARGSVAAWQRTARPVLRRLLGDWPEGRTPLAPRVIWTRNHELGRIEKIAFRCEPGADAVGYLCLPHGAAAPLPVFICLQGHTTGMHLSIAMDTSERKSIAVEGDRDFAIGCLKRGVAAFCLEQRAFGERVERSPRLRKQMGCLDATLQAQLLGRTLIGERVYDVDRAIDYLVTRPEIDARGIGVMGNSSGGAISIYAAALLPRVAFAMPSCYFCTFRDSVMAMNHCEENYVPGLLKHLEMHDILGLFAPKPVVIVAGREDPMFPIAATRAAFRRLQSIYRAAGHAARCHLVVGPGGHRFYADAAWPVMLQEIARLRRV